MSDKTKVLQILRDKTKGIVEFNDRAISYYRFNAAGMIVNIFVDPLIFESDIPEEAIAHGVLCNYRDYILALYFKEGKNEFKRQN